MTTAAPDRVWLDRWWRAGSYAAAARIFLSDGVLHRAQRFVHVYLPAVANTLPAMMAHALDSTDRVNVIVAGTGGTA